MTDPNPGPSADTMGIQVAESPLGPDGVWSFFERIRDVTDLNPAEEQQEAWEATLNGDRVGMAVVDTIPRKYAFVSRIAVDPSHRQRGVASAILKRLSRRHGRLHCRVHKNNTAGQELVDSVGFTSCGTGRYRELIEYDTNPDG